MVTTANLKNQKGKKPKTLYERIGGDQTASLVVDNFFDEMVEHPKLAPFFKNVSTNTLGVHHAKLFRVIFGPEHQRPSINEFRNFMLATHARLFRDLGLNESHFDLVIQCFVESLNSMHTKKNVIDECVGVLLPLRKVFKYGAEVAVTEQEMSPEELAVLPKASSKTMGTEERVTLPNPVTVEDPLWLSAYLGKCSMTSNVRAWTKELADQLGPNEDAILADTFMDMPYMKHHSYLTAFLQLAFLPKGKGSSTAHCLVQKNAMELTNTLRSPRGHSNAPLSRALWTRLINQFARAAKNMFMNTSVIMKCTHQLVSYKYHFPEIQNPVRVNGVEGPHLLQRGNTEAKKLMRSESARVLGLATPASKPKSVTEELKPNDSEKLRKVMRGLSRPFNWTNPPTNRCSVPPKSVSYTAKAG